MHGVTIWQVILVMNTVLNAAALLGCAFCPRLCMATICAKKHWLIKSCADRNMYRVRILFSLSVFTILYDAG